MTIVNVGPVLFGGVHLQSTDGVLRQRGVSHLILTDRARYYYHQDISFYQHVIYFVFVSGLLFMFLFLHGSSDLLVPLQHRWLYSFSIILKIDPFKTLYQLWEYVHPEKLCVSAISCSSNSSIEESLLLKNFSSIRGINWLN